MIVTVEIRDEWVAEWWVAIGDSGSNDDEHDLLSEAAEAIIEAARKDPRYAALVVDPEEEDAGQ